jgi:hypothetical protein
MNANCLHCGKSFRPRRGGHVFCSPWCRHHGERKPYDPPPVDQDQVERLFDPRRDPNEQVRIDDWFSPADAPDEFKALYLEDTVGQRRRWFDNLKLTDRAK